MTNLKMKMYLKKMIIPGVMNPVVHKDIRASWTNSQKLASYDPYVYRMASIRLTKM